MDSDWWADLNSASWDGRDLKFRAIFGTGEIKYVIRGDRLRDSAQRTGPEALSLNLPLLRTLLMNMARAAEPGQILTLA